MKQDLKGQSRQNARRSQAGSSQDVLKNKLSTSGGEGFSFILPPPQLSTPHAYAIIHLGRKKKGKRWVPVSPHPSFSTNNG